MKKARISSKHKSHMRMRQELEKAKKKVNVGGVYSHYKYPENTYRVINLGFIEATDEIAVIYQATYATELIYVRPLSSWLEMPELEGKSVSRFKLLDI